MSPRHLAPPPQTFPSSILAVLQRLGLAIALVLTLSIAACGGSDEEEAARNMAPPPAPISVSTAVASPSSENGEDVDESPSDADSEGGSNAEDAAEASSTEPDDGEGTESGDEVVEYGPATLPADGDAPVLQLARIEHSPWEPEILGQMSPHFSLQSNGFLAFQSPHGDSEDGWYQSVLTSQETEALLRLFMDEIGILEIAEARGEDEIDFQTLPNGEPDGCGAYGVLYVRSAEREGRLVISECSVEAAEGPEGDQLRKLQETVNLLERWKDVSNHEQQVSIDQQDAFRTLLGFYSGIRQPYTPDSAVAFGVRAREDTPTDALSAQWPLERALADTDFPAHYGRDPEELVLQAPDSTALLREGLVFEQTDPRSIWGPLFSEDGETFYLIGVRASVPGSNHVVVPYEHEIPKLNLDSRPSP